MKNIAAMPFLVFCVVIVAVMVTPLQGQWTGNTTTGADIVVGDIVGVSNYTSLGAIDAFACGTTSCNIGSVPVDWIDGVNLHPVIGQNAYRLHDNRFEQVGQSWLKHGFLALNGSLCDTCIQTPTTSLGVGCSDPYNSSLNGTQARLGPKFEVNASTGFYLWPYTASGMTGNSIYKRLQVKTADLNGANFPGASYFIEAQYVAPDDSADGNSANSVSWRSGVFSLGTGSNYNLSLTGSTVRGEPALNAWKAADPNVEIMTYDVTGDGRFNVARLVTDNGDGTRTYEYAINNQTSDRSAYKFEIAIPVGSIITNMGFHDVDYHSGEPYSGTDWAMSLNSGSISWSTSNFASNPNANALRWGTMYNFRFTTNLAGGDGTLHLFKPGAQPNITISFPTPAFIYSFPNGLPTALSETMTTNVLVRASTITIGADPATAMVFTRINGAPFVGAPMTNLIQSDFQATLPPVPCGATLDWYVSIAPLGGGPALVSPEGAPAQFHTAGSSASLAILSSDNAETNQGFTVSGNATDGQWDRGVPVANNLLDPPFDSDGSGQCWLTDNSSLTTNSDVDGGSTILTSPIYNLFELLEARIRFDLWYMTDGTDAMQIEISNGGPWVLVENIPVSLSGWEPRAIRVSDFVTPSANVQFRLTVSDLGTPDIVEAGLDNIRTDSCRYFSDTIAAGNVTVNNGLPPQQVFKINGSNGGDLRRVTVGFGQSLSFEMNQPFTNAFPSKFIIWGTQLTPPPSLEFNFGFGIGSLLFTPCDVNPANPTLFVLTDNFPFSSCPGIIGSPPTPWMTTFPAGLNSEIAVTMQGLIIDPGGFNSLAITNAIFLRISALL